MAIDLTKLTATAPGLVDLYKTARVSLDKHRLGGERAAVYLVIDHSRSMSRYFKDGSVQALAERVLALAAHFDDDGTVPVIFFDTTARQPVDISVYDYAGSIDRIKASAGTMGSTNYAAAMRAVIDLHKGPGPAFVVFQTDGAPNSKRETTEKKSHENDDVQCEVTARLGHGAAQVRGHGLSSGCSSTPPPPCTSRDGCGQSCDIAACRARVGY